MRLKVCFSMGEGFFMFGRVWENNSCLMTLTEEGLISSRCLHGRGIMQFQDGTRKIEEQLLREGYALHPRYSAL